MPTKPKKNSLPRPRRGEGGGGAAPGQSGGPVPTLGAAHPEQTFSLAIPHKLPSVDLVTPEQQQAFLDAVIQHKGVKPACEVTGFNCGAVFYFRSKHKDFAEMLDAAMEAVYAAEAHSLLQRNQELLKMSPNDMNLCANAYRVVNEQTIRMLGKLNAKYSDRPNNLTLNQTNTAIIVDEETRDRLIALQKKIYAPLPLTDLPQEKQAIARVIEPEPNDKP